MLYRSRMKSRLVNRWVWYTSPVPPSHTYKHTHTHHKHTPIHRHKHTPPPNFSCASFLKVQHKSAPVTVHLLDNITLRKKYQNSKWVSWNVPKECWNVLKETYVKKRSTVINLFIQIQISSIMNACLPHIETWLYEVSSQVFF